VHIELSDLFIFHFFYNFFLFDKYLTFYKVFFLEFHCSYNGRASDKPR
jgi:hypothetical protein